MVGGMHPPQLDSEGPRVFWCSLKLLAFKRWRRAKSGMKKYNTNLEAEEEREGHVAINVNSTSTRKHESGRKLQRKVAR